MSKQAKHKRSMRSTHINVYECKSCNYTFDAYDDEINACERCGSDAVILMHSYDERDYDE